MEFPEWRTFVVEKIDMTHIQLYKVTDSKLVITLPPAFRNKEVRVTIDDKVTPETDKMAQMKLASSDPLFLSDLKEVNGDFERKQN